MSKVISLKEDCINAYKSQFVNDDLNGPATYISSNDYTDRVKYRNNLFGKKIGVPYGEGFLSVYGHLGLKSFEYSTRACLIAKKHNFPSRHTSQAVFCRVASK